MPIKRAARVLTLGCGGLAALVGAMLLADRLLSLMDQLPTTVAILARICFAVIFLALLSLLVHAFSRRDSD